MSTRSAIGMVTDIESGNGHSIYCHYDGYPDGVGEKLIKHWNDEAKVQSLIALGDLSYLGSEVGEKVLAPEGEDALRSFAVADSPKGCFSYHRDRGEDWTHTQPVEFTGGSEGFFKVDWDDRFGAEYAYLWTPDGWLVRRCGPVGREEDNPVPLSSLFKFPEMSPKPDQCQECGEDIRLADVARGVECYDNCERKSE